MAIETCLMASPLGRLRLEVDTEAGVTGIDFDDTMMPVGEAVPGNGNNMAPPRSDIGRRLVQLLAAYFDGRGKPWDLPLAAPGTCFQQRVWQALAGIPWGETRSYGELAVQIGAPGAARAVGAACGRNPLAIVVPCHRVVGGDGSLTGYAGGVERKRWLLAHEGVAQSSGGF